MLLFRAMEKENQLYELGYHLVPTVGDEGALSVADAFAKKVASYEGEVSRSEAPKLMDLAYAIEKRIDAKKKRFSNAYFGWMNIHMTSEAAEKLHEDLRNDEAVLRHLLIKKDVEEAPEVALDAEDSVEEGDDEAINENEVDKAIDELIEE